MMGIELGHYCSRSSLNADYKYGLYFLRVSLAIRDFNDIFNDDIDGLVQDCSNSSASAMEWVTVVMH